MNERNEKWLDERLKKTVDFGKVNFDGEKWKKKYPAEYEELVSRARTRADIQRFLWVRQLARVAAVVAVIALVLFLIPRLPSKRVEPTVATFVEDRSPARMLSVLSLSLAYQQGGLDAVDEQCKKAFELLGQKNKNVSIGELLNESNGQKPERNDL
jgi:hypothetical protein